MNQKRLIKIIEVTPTLDVGGAENITRYICKYLNRESFDLSVFCFYRSSRKLWSKNIKITFLNKRKSLDPTLIVSLRHKIKELNPDIIHCHNLNSTIYVCLANLGLRPKIVQTVHNDLVKHSNITFWRIVYKIFHVYIVNLSRRLNPSLQNNNRNFIVANGIETIKNSKCKKKFGKTILNIGRLEKQKNHQMLLSIFFEIIKRDNGYRLTIVGSGTQKDKIMQLIKKLSLTKYVDLITNPIETQTIYKKYSFYMSASSWEGMPLTIIEAQSEGLIVFSSDCGATRDLIKNNITGFILPTKTTSKSAEFFLRKTKDKQALEKVSINAHDTAKYFTAQIMTRRYEKLFQKIHSQA